MKATATSIVHRLRESGHTAYFAGGCVRDTLRGVEPQDFDIATSATPAEVQRLFPKTIPVGAAFGVVLVLEDGHQFEVATFRCDAAYLDGRHPSAVRYGSPEEDAQRRDFTINGLFLDPVTNQILDFVGGRADLDRKLIRCVGEPRQRFTEDKLRLLRCVRFSSNLQFAIEPATQAAVCEMAGQIQVVSAERIRDELIKIFTRPNAGAGLELLLATGLLAAVLPEVAAMKGVEQPVEFHPEGDVFTHTRMMLDDLPAEPGVVLAFSVLLHDVGKPPTFVRAPDRIRFNEHDIAGQALAEQILRRLRFSNDQIEQITLCVGGHMRFQHVQSMRQAKLKRMLARPTFPVELELHRIDCLASHGKLDNYDFLKTTLATMPADVIKPAPLVTGHDLLALGFTPGPLVGAVLQEVAELQLEEQLQSPAAALDYARQRLAGAPPSIPPAPAETG
ncbi:MAG: CCA tRNA nucleotidyltransferase [Verrucomicrobiota bacterium]